MEAFTKIFQRHTALNLEHGNLSLLVGNLPNMKKLIEDNVFGWVGQPLDLVQVATLFLVELKTTVLAL